MSTHSDVIIIGGGAAGLSAAQYCARANLNVMVLEKMASGGQALLIDNLENYPGFPGGINGFEFSERLEEQAKKFGAEFTNTSVRTVEKDGDIFTVETDKGLMTCSAVIVATGAAHRHLGVPGEEELAGQGVSYCATCDGPFFRDGKILVVGGGDAACDEASFLSNLTDRVVHIHRRDRFRAQKSVAEKALKNPSINVRFNHILEEINGDGKVSSVVFRNTITGETYSEEMDAVFIFIGSDPVTSCVPQVKKDESGYIITDEKMETSVKGLFAAGDVRNTPFRQLVVSASDGAIAAHYAAKYIDELKGQAYGA
ncbi:thioredoxin-disulfide reductase [Spirochaeta isovalerica]|uniref:Thioredoxin reductase n=1 Tax=Spirochaeta isovalerica TaxID=150 RepID=A0A841R4G6_9SPIO|nr:thioredoxin-disulfide reductase [Spirochaeta isovalerica]MBB6478683.1 thioredoxin reductase (NADPH) [Spirochaeta isovalerica]